MDLPLATPAERNHSPCCGCSACTIVMQAAVSSAWTKFPNAAQRFPNGMPVGPNLQLKAKPLGSVGAQRGPTEPQRTPFPLGFSPRGKHDRDAAGPP